MNELQRLHADFNQSPWLDYINRDFLTSGKLAELVSKGIRGLTSNPTIFEQAITASAVYDADIDRLFREGHDAEQLYWQIAKDDIREAASMLRSVYDASGGSDGFVSFEVSPRYAHDTAQTIAQAHELWNDLGVPNLMIKVPATPEGIPAIKQLISEGINVNVTLIFSIEQYEAALNAYIDGVAQSTSTTPVHSVASFFISRVDSEVDARLTAIGTDQALGLRAKAALAQGHIAYGVYMSEFNDDKSRWYTLSGSHANVSRQRLLWASTGVKNPDYDPLLYVVNLIADNSVNTLPLATIDYMLEHLPAAQSSITTEMAADGASTLKRIGDAGVDMTDVLAKLNSEGLSKFEKSFDSLLASIEAKRPR
jgi:transaldolase